MLFWKKKESANKKANKTEKLNYEEDTVNKVETESFALVDQEDDFVKLNGENSKVEEEILITLDNELKQEEDIIELSAEDSKVEEEILTPLEMEQEKTFAFDGTSNGPIQLEENQEIITLISEIEKEVPESVFLVEEDADKNKANEEQYEVYRSKLKNMFAKHSK